MNVEHELWALNGVPDRSEVPGDRYAYFRLCFS